MDQPHWFRYAGLLPEMPQSPDHLKPYRLNAGVCRNGFKGKAQAQLALF